MVAEEVVVEAVEQESDGIVMEEVGAQLEVVEHQLNYKAAVVDTMSFLLLHEGRVETEAEKVGTKGEVVGMDFPGELLFLKAMMTMEWQLTLVRQSF